MLSEFQKQKLKLSFEIKDLDRDGFLTKADYERVLENLAKLTNYQPGSPDYENLESKFMSSWYDMEKLAEKNQEGKISLDDWFNYYENVIRNADSYKALGEDLYSLMFELVDTDSDGKISAEEYKRLGMCYSVPENIIDEVFSQKDRDGDGYITKEEYTQYNDSWFYSEESQASGNVFVAKVRND